MQIEYIQEGDAIRAVVTSDDGLQRWDHYLDNDELWFYANEPDTCDAKIALLAQAQFPPVDPPSPPEPVSLRSASIDPTAAATTVATRDALKAQLDGAQAQILAAVKSLPIDRVQAIVTQVQALIEGQ